MPDQLRNSELFKLAFLVLPAVGGLIDVYNAFLLVNNWLRHQRSSLILFVPAVLYLWGAQVVHSLGTSVPWVVWAALGFHISLVAALGVVAIHNRRAKLK